MNGHWRQNVPFSMNNVEWSAFSIATELEVYRRDHFFPDQNGYELGLDDLQDKMDLIT
jgi:hypothetical protein